MNDASERARPRTVGWLALALAAAGTLVIVQRTSSAFDIYCDWSRPCLDVLIAALPMYLAWFGMALAGVLIAKRLLRSSGPRFLTVSALVCATLGLMAFLGMWASAYDQMWATYGTTAQLDAPRIVARLPASVLMTTSLLWPALLGAWIVLTSLELEALRVPRALVIGGVAAGLAVDLLVTLAVRDARPLDTLAVVLVVIWACVLGLWLLVTSAGRTSASRPEISAEA